MVTLELRKQVAASEVQLRSMVEQHIALLTRCMEAMEVEDIHVLFAQKYGRISFLGVPSQDAVVSWLYWDALARRVASFASRGATAKPAPRG